MTCTDITQNVENTTYWVKQKLQEISRKQYILVNYENKLSSMLDDNGKKVLDDYIKLLFDV